MFAVVLIALLAVCDGRLMSLHEDKADHGRELSSASFCTSPKRKEKVVFPDSIAGRAKINYDMYSGYMNVTSSPDYLFYWFFSTKDKNPDAPLIIWTNGKYF